MAARAASSMEPQVGEMALIEQRGVAMLVTLDATGEVASLAQVEETGA